MEALARSPEQLGVAINQARRSKNLTQMQLAAKVGVRQATISQIEKGMISAQIDTICSILAALDLELVVRGRSKSNTKSIEELF